MADFVAKVGQGAACEQKFATMLLGYANLARFLLYSLGWRGARKRGVPLPCVTSAYTTSSHALQRSVTSLRPTTSTPVHVGLPRLRIPQRRSAFFPERSSPFPPR